MVGRVIAALGKTELESVMGDTESEKLVAGQQPDASWPPPDGQPQLAAQDETRTHVISATTDTVLGLLIGIASYWAVFYAITNYILYYVIPHTIRSQWSFLTGALLALLVVLIVWLGLRLFYRQLANSFIMGAAIPAIAILYLV